MIVNLRSAWLYSEFQANLNETQCEILSVLISFYCSDKIFLLKKLNGEKVCFNVYFKVMAGK